MINSSINLKKTISLLCIIFVYICFFEPVYISQLFVPHLMCQLIVFGYASFLVIKLINRKKKWHKFTLLFVCYFIWIILVSLIKSNCELALIRIALASICILLNFEIRGFEYNRKVLLHVYFILLTINLLFNLLGYAYIDSVTNNGGWFLTGSNALIVYCLPATCVAYASIEVNKNKLISVFIIIISIYTAFLSETATTIFVLLLFAGIMVVQKLIHKKVINLKAGVWLIVVLFFIVVVFQIQEKIFIFRFIVQDLLGRELDFTARTYIWVESIKQFIAAPFIGNGYGYSFRVPVMANGFLADHAHNQYLQQLIQGGIVQGILFIMIIRETLRSVGRTKRIKENWCITATIIVGIMFLVEYYFTTSIFTLFAILYYYGLNYGTFDNKYSYR